MLTIKEIEARLKEIEDETDPFFALVEKDERKGVVQVLASWRKQREQVRALREKFVEMTKFEEECRCHGYQLIAGIDEVGRGPLAGPVTAAAVILPEDFFLPGIDDSKKLSEKKREEYGEFIRQNALAVSVAMIESQVVDEINIYEATKKAMAQAVAGLHPSPDFLLIDAVKLASPYPSKAIIKGDAQSISIAAASIVAKVERDHFMKELALKFPAYGFEKNMGYGTKEHLQAIQKYGITPYHRKSFSPIKEMLEPDLFSSIIFQE
jgi:ribonuclease HII